VPAFEVVRWVVQDNEALDDRPSHERYGREPGSPAGEAKAAGHVR